MGRERGEEGEPRNEQREFGVWGVAGSGCITLGEVGRVEAFVLFTIMRFSWVSFKIDSVKMFGSLIFVSIKNRKLGGSGFSTGCFALPSEPLIFLPLLEFEHCKVGEEIKRSKSKVSE